MANSNNNNSTASAGGISSSSPVSLPGSSTNAVTSPQSTLFETVTSLSTQSALNPSSQPSSTATLLSTFTTTAPISTQPSNTQSQSVSVVTEPASSNGGTPTVQTIVITSTQPHGTATTGATQSSTTGHPSSSSSNAAAAQTPGASNQSNGSLSQPGKIAVAVVVPVAAVALIVVAVLFYLRRRKQRRDAEELRRKEVEEYGFNPNNDPTLPAVGGASSLGDEPSEMRETDGAGYRGWGTTSTARKASTTLSSGNGPIGMALSDSGSNTGGYHKGSPTGTTAPNSDVQSGDPLVGSGRPNTSDSETIGALGSAPTSMGNRQDIHRGPSNASSAYSRANKSDTSGEGPVPPGSSGPQYYNEGMYFDDGIPQRGPYGDGSYGGGQPVIRDVQARRNTRIESPSVVPHQGNAGIAQNF